MFNKNRKRGFTLVEVMIGMMILTVAIVSSTSLLIGLMNSNKNIVQRMQAFYLAQEGIENVRNKRDTNWMNNKAWDEGLSVGTSNMVDICRREDTGFVNGEKVFKECLTGQTFLFKRKTEISKNSDSKCVLSPAALTAPDPYCDNSVLVTVTVTWGNSNELKLTNILTNWKSGSL